MSKDTLVFTNSNIIQGIGRIKRPIYWINVYGLSDTIQWLGTTKFYRAIDAINCANNLGQCIGRWKVTLK